MSKVSLFHDNFQNYKRYGIPKAQLVIADVPYNLGVNAYASSTEWYNGGDNRNGESKKAAKPFFNGDGDFNLVEYFHFCSKLLKKNYSAQVLKANMKIVGATEYALLLYRDKLPKFNNNGKMVFNWFEWKRDGKEYPKIHPTQKPVSVLKRLIEICTDEGDVVIDPCAGSGSTLRAAMELGRSAYGFEVSSKFYKSATEQMLNPDNMPPEQIRLEI